MKTIVVLSIAALCAAVGDTFLSYGMRNAGMVSAETPGKIFEHVTVVFRNIHVAVGVAFMGAFFYLYLASLSWADLSFAKPITSLSFVFAAVFAAVFLREDVSWYRWAGTLLIVAGVIVVSRDHNESTPSSPDAVQVEAQK